MSREESRRRHERLQELFLAAVDLEADAQVAFCSQACGGDETLRRELLDLLPADRLDAGGPGAEDPEARRVKPAELAGGNCSYEILRELGRGGAGVVYLARRCDDGFRRQVAIKVLRSGPEELLVRFRAEQRILATLDHPNIARLFDGGTTAHGSPFLVMEYIAGEPITDYVRRHELNLDDRLDLFLAVCRAVQIAHQSLVVHRDIKPANVLVTDEGIPKLLDFGIAKILDPSAVDWTTAETVQGGQPLTPRYASPEQLMGRPITTATDIWALGILLHELLVGEVPFESGELSPRQWITAVCEDDVVMPSNRIGEGALPPALCGMVRDRAHLARRLSGDLDAILLKALRKEPSQRYGSAAEFAADIERHLGGWPVRARRGTLRYRSSKFVKRHRLGLAVVALALVSATAAALGLLHLLHLSRIEKARADTVKELLIQVFSAAEPGHAGAGDLSARQVLDAGLEQVVSSIDDEPEVKAELLEAIGQIYNNLGELDRAAQAYGTSIELRRQRRDTDPLGMASSLSGLALIHVARADFDEAERLQRQAIELTVGASKAEDARSIAARDGLQQILAQAGRHREARQIADEVVRLTLARLGLSSVDEALTSGSHEPALVALATTLGSLAAEERQVGDFDAARADFERALRLNQRLLGDQHYTVAFNRNNLANLLSDIGRRDEAVNLRSQALKTALPALGPDHPSVAAIELSQGYDLIGLGRCEEAEAEIARAGTAYTASLGPEHPAVALVRIYSGLAATCLGRAEEVFSEQEQALEVLRSGLGQTHPELARALSTVARTASALARHEEALALEEEAISIATEALGTEHPATLDYELAAAATLYELNRGERAWRLLNSAVAVCERRGDLPTRLVRARQLLAKIDENPAASGVAAGSEAPGGAVASREALSVSASSAGTRGLPGGANRP